MLEANDDIAAAILEPTGAHGAQLPIDPKFLTELRELTRQHGVLLIFDEVVTGFRVSPGGAQAEYGIRPDLTTLAKILAGGLPGGAVAGRKDILDLLDFQITKAVRPREDLPSGHVQRQPALGRGRGRGTRNRRHDRRLRPRQSLRREDASPDQRGVRGGARAVGGLRVVLELPHLHQPRPPRRSSQPASIRSRSRRTPSSTNARPGWCTNSGWRR